MPRASLPALFVTAALSVIGLSVYAISMTGVSRAESRPVKIAAQALRLDSVQPGRAAFGKLQFLCGLTLTSEASGFGGYSGLVLGEHGKKLIAVSDAGTWLTGKLEYDGVCMTGLSNARISPILGLNGKPVAGKRNKDAEALALPKHGLLAGEIYVAFEHKHRIWAYALKHDAPSGKPYAIKAKFKNLRSNSGIEGLALLQGGPNKGGFLAAAESGPDPDADEGQAPAWLISNGKQSALSIRLKGGFKVTGLQSLKDGGVLVLERRFKGLLDGVHMRIRRIASGDIKPGAMLEGEILVQLGGHRYRADNMEAIAIHEAENGDRVITLLSDDNFNAIQRTILLQFKLD